MHPLKKYVYVFPVKSTKEFGGTTIILEGLLALLISIAPNVVCFLKLTLRVNARSEGTNINWYTDTYSSNSAILSSSVERKFIEEILEFLVFLDSSIIFIISEKKKWLCYYKAIIDHAVTSSN